MGHQFTYAGVYRNSGNSLRDRPTYFDEANAQFTIFLFPLSKLVHLSPFSLLPQMAFVRNQKREDGRIDIMAQHDADKASTNEQVLRSEWTELTIVQKGCLRGGSDKIHDKCYSSPFSCSKRKKN